jgi:hypothetical protein
MFPDESARLRERNRGRGPLTLGRRPRATVAAGVAKRVLKGDMACTSHDQFNSPIDTA